MLRQSAPPCLPARPLRMARHPAGGKSAGPGARGEKTHLLQTSMHPRPAGKAALGTTQKAFCRHKTRCVNGRRHKPSPQGAQEGREREPPLLSAQGFSPPRVGGTITSCLPTGTVKYSPRVGESARAQTCAGGKRAGPPCKTSPQGAAPEKMRGSEGARGEKKRGDAGKPPLPHPAQGRGRKNRRKKSASPCPEPRGRTEKKGGTGCRRRGRGRGAGRRLCACFPLPIAGEGHTRKA